MGRERGDATWRTRASVVVSVLSTVRVEKLPQLPQWPRARSCKACARMLSSTTVTRARPCAAAHLVRSCSERCCCARVSCCARLACQRDRGTNVCLDVDHSLAQLPCVPELPPARPASTSQSESSCVRSLRGAFDHGTTGALVLVRLHSLCLGRPLHPVCIYTLGVVHQPDFRCMAWCAAPQSGQSSMACLRDPELAQRHT